MGKKRAAIIGSPEEDQLKVQKDVKREQKKLREGKSVKSAETKEVQPVVTTPTESVSEVKHAPTSLPLQSTPQGDSETKTPKKTHHRSKSYLSLKSQVSPDKIYPLTDGLALLRKISSTKFDSTVELHLILKSNPTSKLTVALPHSFGKSRTVAIATDAVIANIEKGHIDFDVLVASPSQMSKLVKFAKVLGPKGLMPNPKNGTVSDKPEDTAKKLSQDTSTSLKLDKSGPVIHTSIGKLSFKDDQLEENITAVLSTLSGNLRKVVLKSTMSPAIKIQF
jgi:large subunit ribosomal protein L1